jgi:hypothetical protein
LNVYYPEHDVALTAIEDIADPLGDDGFNQEQSGGSRQLPQAFRTLASHALEDNMQQWHAIHGDSRAIEKLFASLHLHIIMGAGFLHVPSSRVLFVGLSRATRNRLVLDHVDRRPVTRRDGFPAMFESYLRHRTIHESQKCLLDGDVETAALLAG